MSVIQNLTPYQYLQLQATDHIRVLSLEPGYGNDILRCRLTEVSLDEAECKYEGISYFWGGDGDVTNIECEGRKLSIQANLASALKTFRYAAGCRWLWADSVCINQKDSTEKGYQVRRMGEIYRKSSRVLCWLGNDDRSIAERSFRLVRDASQQLAYKWQDDWTFENLVNDSKLPGFTRETHESFVTLLNLPWFGRVW